MNLLVPTCFGLRTSSVNDFMTVYILRLKGL